MGDDDQLQRYIAEAANQPLLSMAEERELADKAAAGDEEAAARLVSANLRLVVAIARKYAATGVSMLDLIQDGNLALLRAVETYEPDKGFTFRSYATLAIRKVLGEAVHGAEDPRLARLQDAWDAFVVHAGRQPSLAELATETGMTEDDVVDLLGRPPD